MTCLAARSASVPAASFSDLLNDVRDCPGRKTIDSEGCPACGNPPAWPRLGSDPSRCKGGNVRGPVLKFVSCGLSFPSICEIDNELLCGGDVIVEVGYPGRLKSLLLSRQDSFDDVAGGSGVNALTAAVLVGDA